LRDWLLRVLVALEDQAQVVQVLERLRQEVQGRTRVQNRQQNPSHAQLLNEPELLNWVP
jgi:hypothetical protein